MAWKTVNEKSMGRPMRKASAAMAQTALTGVPVHQLMAAHTLYSGTPPSRLKLHSTLLARAWGHHPRGRHPAGENLGQGDSTPVTHACSCRVHAGACAHAGITPEKAWLAVR